MATKDKDDDFEPRLVSVETELSGVARNIDSLTRDVRELTAAVKAQGDNNAGQIQQLLVGVANASGPRKTDWNVVLAAVLVIMSIGAAAFSPMLIRIGDLQASLDKQLLRFDDHQNLRMHPVGETRINAFESSLKDAISVQALSVRDLDTKLQKEFGLVNETLRDRLLLHAGQIKDLDIKLQREFELSDRNMQSRVTSLQATLVVIDEKIRELEKQAK